MAHHLIGLHLTQLQHSNGYVEVLIRESYLNDTISEELYNAINYLWSLKQKINYESNEENKYR